MCLYLFCLDAVCCKITEKQCDMCIKDDFFVVRCLAFYYRGVTLLIGIGIVETVCGNDLEVKNEQKGGGGMC